MTAHIVRGHDTPDSGTGSLGALGSGQVVSFVAHAYDDANRLIRIVDFGTNTSNGIMETGGVAPTWPPSAIPDPGASSGPIVTAQSYNERGLLDVSKDPRDVGTKYFYDDLSRRIGTMKNFSGTGSLAWNTTSAMWQVTGLSSTDPSVNRTTSYVYDGDGHTTKMVAHRYDASVSGDNPQITKYLYAGTSAGTS